MFLLIVNNYGFCSCGIETRVRHMLKSHRQFNGASRAKRRWYSEGLMVVFYAQALRGAVQIGRVRIAAVIGYWIAIRV